MRGWTSIWGHGNRTSFEPLKIDFEIPELLQNDIDGYLDDRNNHDGRMADCYEEEIRPVLNCCDDWCMTEGQIQTLREYYCRGGIYDDPEDEDS